MSVKNGEVDQWHHAYFYDADNRIQRVYTSTATPLTPITRLSQNLANELEHNADWQLDAQYYYYDHGPLARVEIGQNALQGVDYYYTLQGWLKGVNSSVLNHENDPGKDSNPNNINALFAKDVFGFSLDYYQGDYTAINGKTPHANVQNTSHAAQNSADLYNGNIRYMQTSIINPLDRTKMPMLNAYGYDQLNRLKESRSYENGLSSNTWNPTSYGNEYFNAFTYDAMGNILTQERHNRAGEIFDDLQYHYQKDASGKLLRNRLYHVNDDPDLASVMEDDIEDMEPFISAVNQINTNNNYSYDAEGRLVKDRQEEIDTIIWTVSGKVKEIRRTLQSTKKNLTFEYDAFGNRIAKHVYDNQTLMLEKSTYYILDASGNQLSMYEHAVDDADVKYYLTERNIYGSSRLGTLKDPVNMFNAEPLQSYGILGNRNYELSNHLGNVLTVISDIKYPLSDDNTTISGYEVGISNIFDYSPFGAPLDGRTIDNIFHHPSQNNGSQTPADTVEIYNNNFDNPPATGSPYYSTEVTLDAHLSNTNWTSSTGAFTNYNSSGAGSGKSIAITTASADTAYLTLAMDVDSGYELDITSYSFAHRSSATGYDSYTLVVNGIEIGSGSIYVASSGSTLQSTGVVDVSNPISGQTGTVGVVLKLYGGTHGHSGTFRMDDFVLNGFVREENSGYSSSDYFVSRNHRYSFQNQEKHDEIRGKGNYINYKYRGYDPRVGRLDWLVDPLSGDYSPYAFSGNRVLDAVELEGLEPDVVHRRKRPRTHRSFSGVGWLGRMFGVSGRGKYTRNIVWRGANRTMESRGDDPTPPVCELTTYVDIIREVRSIDSYVKEDWGTEEIRERTYGGENSVNISIDFYSVSDFIKVTDIETGQDIYNGHYEEELNYTTLPGQKVKVTIKADSGFEIKVTEDVEVKIVKEVIREVTGNMKKVVSRRVTESTPEDHESAGRSRNVEPCE